MVFICDITVCETKQKIRKQMIYIQTATSFQGPLNLNQFQKIFRSGRIHPSLTLVKIARSSKKREAKEVMHALNEVAMELGLKLSDVPDRILQKAIFQLYGIDFDTVPRKARTLQNAA